MNPETKAKIFNITERFENGLMSAGLVDVGRIDYDILSDVRMTAWKAIEQLIVDASESQRKSCEMSGGHDQHTSQPFYLNGTYSHHSESIRNSKS